MNNNNRTFIFDSFYFDISNKKLYLRYSFDEEYKFEEIIEFPNSKVINEFDKSILNKIFKYLHLACGVSYYKLFVPFNIEVKTFVLNNEEAEFFKSFYLNGLGEFAYKNNITDIADRINFPYNKLLDTTNNSSEKYNYSDKKVIAVGGGKDSVVSIEILKQLYNNIELSSIDGASSTALPIKETINVSGLNSFHPKRIISHNIIDLNNKLNEIHGYNGHIPISGIFAFIFLASSVLYDFDTVFLSNEKSANIGNTEFSGRIVNHQWSKSFEFECEFNKFCKKFIINNFNYISFLRPLSEIYIAKIFSELKKYHGVFTSCNKVFKIENKNATWCCDCDKCRFVFLILSVFLTKSELINIFGKNIFDDKTQLQGFLELCGLDNFKPFECVGEIKESVYSILNTNKDFENDYIIKEIKSRLPKDIDIKKLENELFVLDVKHLLNNDMFNILKKNCC